MPDESGCPLPRPPVSAQLRLLKRLFEQPAPVLDELSEQLGPVYGLGAGPVRLAVIGDPEALREMFAMSTDTFRWGHKFNALGFVVGSESLIVSDGDVHRRRRRSVQAAFSRRRLNGWIPTIVERTDDALTSIVDQAVGGPERIDLYPECRRLVLDIVVRSLFGARMAGRAAEIAELFQRPQDYLESPAIRQLPHPFPRTRRARVRADRRALDAIIDDEIADRRATPSDDPHDVLAVLVAEGDLSDSEIRDQVVTLIGAGYDTTSASLAWMLWRCALAPDVWSDLRAEADGVFGDTAATAIDDTHLARLEHASRVMRETLRLHPAGVVSPRETAQEIVIAGFRIPKGTLILWSPHLAGRDPAAWPDPLRFDPARFEELDGDRNVLANLAWVPFGRGQRNCLGFALAQMELTLIVARFAQRIDIDPGGGVLPDPVGMVVNRPRGGARLIVSVA